MGEQSQDVLLRVSVVIVNWNTRDVLDQALRSLNAESTEVAFETIVVDNGSEDGSAELVRQSWPQVHLISLPKNVGFAAANNIGFAQGHGDLVLLLNSDTIVLPGMLRNMVDFLDRHPRTGCVGARHLNPDKSLQRSVDDFPSLLNDLLCYSGLHHLRPVQRFLRRRFAWWGDHDVIREVGWVNGACMLVRRCVIGQVGGLDEGFFIYAEEIDWCYRMWQAGWRVHFIPNAEVIHIGGQAMNRTPSSRILLKYSGLLRFYRKHYSFATVIGLRAIIFVVSSTRLLGIVGLWLLSRSGARPSQRLWEAITQEPIMTDYATMLRAWWRILRLAVR